MEQNFKVGDKVKLPKSKSIGVSYQNHLDNDADVRKKCKYFTISTINYFFCDKYCITLKEPGDNIFLPEDLELYEENPKSTINNDYSIF